MMQTAFDQIRNYDNDYAIQSIGGLSCKITDITDITDIAALTYDDTHGCASAVSPTCVSFPIDKQAIVIKSQNKTRARAILGEVSKSADMQFRQ